MAATASLAPAFLLSMPQMLDPNISRTVVLLCKHSDEGAFGLVVNRPLVTTGRVTVNLDPPVSTERELQVWVGGPVEPQRSLILVGQEPDEPWPLFLRDHDNNVFGARLQPGDALLYRGIELAHWREAYPGERMAQVFLHYVDRNGPNADQKFDGRAGLGLPGVHREPA